jgi:hypothetical protein
MIRDAASGRPPGARLLLAAAAVLLLSVSPRGSAQAVAAAPKAPAAAAESKSLADRLPAAVSDAQKLVATVRAVPFPGTVPSALLPEKELAKVLEQKLSEDLPVPFGRYAASLAALGLVPPGADLREPMMRLYARQVAGFYDPDEKKFYVVPERAGEAARGAAGLGPLADRIMEDALLTHELMHALQDRHLDLSKRLKGLRENGDAQMALQAMLEGEATVVMMQAVLSRLPPDLRDRLSTGSLLASMAQMAAGGLEGADGVPEFFVKELLFPYTSGTEWVEKKRAGGGWAALDAAWKRPPATTSEILHPDRPVAPRKRIPDASRPASAEIPAGTALLWHDRFGEWMLRTVLEAAGAPDPAGLAAEWQDDRIVFFEPNGVPDGPVGFVWRLRLLSADGARRLADVLAAFYEPEETDSGAEVARSDDVVTVVRRAAPPKAPTPATGPRAASSRPAGR